MPLPSQRQLRQEVAAQIKLSRRTESPACCAFRGRREPSHDWTPERVFDRRWVLTILEHVLGRLGAEYAEKRKDRVWEQLRPYLTAASVTLGTYSLFIGVAALTLRRLRARLFVLLAAVIAGLFLPAVIALNVAMEFPRMPEWPVAIPLWLGVPAALWVVVTLFRDHVRRAFAAAAEPRGVIELPGEKPGKFVEWLFTGTGAVVGVLSVLGPLALLLGLAAWFPPGRARHHSSWNRTLRSREVGRRERRNRVDDGRPRG